MTWPSRSNAGIELSCDPSPKDGAQGVERWLEREARLQS